MIVPKYQLPQQLYSLLSYSPNICKLAKLNSLYKKRFQNRLQKPLANFVFAYNLRNYRENNSRSNYGIPNLTKFSVNTNWDFDRTILLYLTDKILMGFCYGLLSGMILFDLQKVYYIINYNDLSKRYLVLDFQLNLQCIDRRFQVTIKMNTPVLLPSIVKCQKDLFWGPLLFLLYVNDMFQAVDCDLFLYAGDAQFIYQHRDVKITDENLKNL